MDMNDFENDGTHKNTHRYFIAVVFILVGI